MAMMAIFEIEMAAEAAAAAEAISAAEAASVATAALTAGELSGVGAAASGLSAIPAGMTQAEAAAMAQSAAAGGQGAGAGINALQQGAITSPVTAPNIINSSVNPVTGVPGSFNPSFDPTSLGATPPPELSARGIPSALPVAPLPPPTTPFAGPAPTAGLAQYGPYPELKVGQGGGGFLNNLFGGPPSTGAEAFTAKTPGDMYTLPGEGGAAPTSAFERGLDKAMAFAQKNPLTTASLAYTGAKTLGLLNPNYSNFNSAPYSGPLSKYKLSPNYQATIANPSQYQYAPRYAEGGIMQMAQGGVTGSGNLTLNVPIDFGQGQNSTQSTPNYAFGNESSGANTGFFGQNSTQVNSPVNPQGPTNSFMTQQAGTPDLMQSFQQLKPEAQSAPINVGGPADVSQDQNQPQRFAGGGSTGNLSSTLDYYTKMMEGETPKMPSSHPTDAGIYHDTDPDTRSLDPYSAARTRLAKINKRAYVTAPKGPEPYPAGQLNLSPPGAKADGTQYLEAAKGGIMGVSDLGGYAAGGNPRLLKGPGDGMSDNIPATINGRQPARLADGEFVIPADVVSHLGNGSTEAGAKVLHQMMTKVRQERTGNPKQGKQINPHKYIPR
jgi:hypothetical protein